MTTFAWTPSRRSRMLLAAVLVAGDFVSHQTHCTQLLPPSPQTVCGAALQTATWNLSVFEIIPVFLRIKFNPDRCREPVYSSELCGVTAALGGAKWGTRVHVQGQDLHTSPLLLKPANWMGMAHWRTSAVFTVFTACWFSLHEIIWPFLLNQRKSERLAFAVILISREQFFAAPVNRT